MVVTYTTALNVQALLQRQTAFSVSTVPTLAQVESLIEAYEDHVDNDTDHAWRETTITEEFVDKKTNYVYGTGIKFKLLHRKIKTFSTGDGDKLEVWDGNSWVDYLVSKTEGRNEDYWTDEESGVFYIRSTYRIFPKGVRVTYRFGESTVNQAIRLAVDNFVASDIILMYDSQVTFAEDGGTIAPSRDRRSTFYREQAEKYLGNLKEYATF